MNHTITDTQMLTSARRALAAHRATRPATAAEAAEIAARYRADAEAHRAYADRLRSVVPPQACDRTRGPSAMAEQHAGAVAVSTAVLASLHADREAGVAEMRAEAWERCLPETAWAEAEAELIRRVDHYARLTAAAPR